MPPKIRQLKASAKAGFVWRPGKGSHTVWTHPALPELEVTLSGHDGNDAKPYQVKDVQKALKHLGENYHGY
ncbi:MAG TPA: type II toxin-antitoxin system HicA family toxin [Ktedonobacteraceae bacterium]|nr:type II toxin-antitoxin system HicA family toxin [Ktedonobacteraceae bacterium]